MPLHNLFDIALRYDGHLALAIADGEPYGETLGTAYLFDLATKSQVRTFPVRYERQGPRLALSRDDRFCFAGCNNSYGLAGYYSETGEEAWRRKDLEGVQAVTSSMVEDWVFCCKEYGSAHLVDTATGKTLERLMGVKRVHPSPYDQSVIVGGRGLELHRPLGTKVASIERLHPQENFCGFSRSEFVVCEVNGLRCFDLATQELLWSFAITEGRGTVRVWYCESLGAFVAQRMGSEFLVFEARTGTQLPILDLEWGTGWIFGIFGRGAQLLAGNLLIHSVETGAILADLATPELHAWDPVAKMQRFSLLATSGKSPEELHQYMVAEGFTQGDIKEVLMMKFHHDRKKG